MEQQTRRSQSFPLIEPLEPRTLLAAWGALPKLIDQDLAAARFKTTLGQGQAVAVIDSGVNYRHPALGGRWGRTVIAGYDFVDRDNDPMDESGHGTQVASIIAGKGFSHGGFHHRGIAPGAKIVALRVADSSDRLPDRRIEEALQWVIRHRKRYNITAINISLGSGHYASPVSLRPYGDELRTLHSAGVFIAAASGNSGVRNPAGVDYPAAHPNVYAVGSVNLSDTISKFTSRGQLLDLLAPGEGVPTAYYNRNSRRFEYILSSGTSFATPHAVGAAVLVRQVNPRLKPRQIMSVLKISGTANPDGDDESPSTGLTFRRLGLDGALARAAANYQKRLLSLKSVKTGTKLLSTGEARASAPQLPLLTRADPPRTGSSTSLSLFSDRRRIADSLWGDGGAKLE